MRFTPREVQILERMRLGDAYKEIAYRFGMSESGVKNALYLMRAREDFFNTTQALALYVEWRCLQRQLREMPSFGAFPDKSEYY